MILDKVKEGNKLSHYETIRKNKNNKLIDVSVTVLPMYDVDGKLIGVSTITIDIIECKKKIN